MLIVGSLCVTLVVAQPSPLRAEDLEYRAAPLDNPLKGLVPYANAGEDRFPHSLEFQYFALSDVLVGRGADGKLQFDWLPIERFLDQVQSRGRQGIFRLHCEYPRRTSDTKPDIPKFLLKAGVEVTQVPATQQVGQAGEPTHASLSPDYENPVLRSALQATIAALGARFDGDPRIGFVEVGMLGFWGEWHTYPAVKHMASTEVQAEVLQAFEDAFTTTKLLVRYPAGEDNRQVSPNVHRSFGYHDDSFTWSTRFDKASPWFFMTRMADAGARTKWKMFPIGGELYPQLNATVFNKQSHYAGRSASDFLETVEETHATYMRLNAVFQTDLSESRRRRAEAAVQRMGYEFYVRRASIRAVDEGWQVTATVQNRGVAPFYYPWKAFLGWMDDEGNVVEESPVDWRIDGLLPDSERTWTATIKIDTAVSGGSTTDATLALRIANPMPGGKPLCFANATQQLDADAWLVLGDSQP